MSNEDTQGALGDAGERWECGDCYTIFELQPKRYVFGYCPKCKGRLTRAGTQWVDDHNKAARCGGDNCMGLEVEGVASWVRKERLEEAEAERDAKAALLDDANKRHVEDAELHLADEQTIRNLERLLDEAAKALQDSAEVLHILGFHFENGHGVAFEVCDMSVCAKALTAIRSAQEGK